MLVLHLSSPWKLKAGKQRRWSGVRLRNRKKESCLENSSWLTQTTQSSCFSCQVSKNWITPLSGWNLQRNGFFIILWSLISTIQPFYLVVKLQRKQGDVVWYKQSALRKSEILQGSHMNNHGECPWRPAARTKLRFSTHTETSTLPNA